TLRLLIEFAADFALTIPFILIGLIHLIRNQRSTALGLALTLGPVALFHLPYHYLKLRDLLFLFPVLCALSAVGLKTIFARLHSPARSWKLEIGILGFGILLLARFSAQLPLLSGYYTYGFLTAEGRARLDSIAALTEPNAVISASLNSGAISLYAQRDTFRPGRLLQPGRMWTDAELIVFVTALHAKGRPLYLLADSEEMAAPLEALDACCRIIPIAELYLPYYYRSGAAANQLIPLYRIEIIP
ncbi:MAG TPA: hypothetical protein VJ020_11640, partial [Anaerolineales bacterium]|nr:hypothetical protein [Anaerolineales bacterium]